MVDSFKKPMKREVNQKLIINLNLQLHFIKDDDDEFSSTLFFFVLDILLDGHRYVI